MVYLLVRAVTSIYHVSFAEIVAQDRRPRMCEARNLLVYSLVYDAGLRVAQVGRIVQRRDAQCHDIVKAMHEKRVTTPYRNTRIKLDKTFARINRESISGHPILCSTDLDSFPSIPEEDQSYFG
jgi:hypothetical protein